MINKIAVLQFKTKQPNKEMSMNDLINDNTNISLALKSPSSFKSEMIVDLPPSFSNDHYIKWLSFGAYHVWGKQEYRTKAKDRLDSFKENEKQSTKKANNVKAARVTINPEFIEWLDSLKNDYKLTIRDTIIMVMIHIKNNPSVFFKK